MRLSKEQVEAAIVMGDQGMLLIVVLAQLNKNLRRIANALEPRKGTRTMSTEIKVGKSCTFTTAAKTVNDAPLPTEATLEWENSDPSVLQLDVAGSTRSAQGVGLAPGTAVVTVRGAGLNDECETVVVSAAAEVAPVEPVTPEPVPAVDLPKGTIGLVVTVNP